jgi:hypothetical protein
MNEQFIPYEEALVMKELGFDEPCFKGYTEEYKDLINFSNTHTNTSVFNTLPTRPITAPLYQQAFKWFRDKYNLYSEIDLDSYKEPYLLKISIKQLDESNTFVSDVYYPHCIDGLDTFNNKQYKEAELACIKKLIEIVKDK